jgi:hypothetical protein
MSDFIKTFISKNRPQILTYKKYIKDNDWTTLKSIDLPEGAKGKIKTTVELRLEEFNIQNDLINSILIRLKRFVTKSQGEHHLKTFKTFIKEVLDLVTFHTERADDYRNNSNVIAIVDKSLRASEIAFHNLLYKTIATTDDNVLALSIKEEQITEGIQWLDKQKASVAMLETLMLQQPEIKTKIESMGIDFYADPPQTLHILNPKPPEYNPNKNAWEQDKKVLEYYVQEYNKIQKGVTIDGYYIEGWLYFHFNFFVTTIPKTIEINGIKENKDETKVPQLRDNEIIMTEYFLKSKKEQTISAIIATRRLAKTTLNSSRIVRATILNKKQILCAGGSSEDLTHIHNNIYTCQQNINPAFKLYYLAPTEDGRGKSYGIKTKDNKSKVTSNVFIINLEGGTKKSKKESLAGFTPDEFIVDEFVKFPFKEQLTALEPALWGDGILRCSVMLTGTGGSIDLAKDAIKLINNPEKSKVTLMDWSLLERHVKPEHITWKRRKYGLFLPTQMCIKHPKIKSNLADYLGIKSDTLSKVTLWVTDWELAKERELKERQDKIHDKLEYTKLLAYHPFDPDEIFLSGAPSPFENVVELAKQHIEELTESGEWDRRRDLIKNSEGVITEEISTKPLVDFPFIGSNQDAPYLILESPDFKSKIPLYYYVASGDFYKQLSAESTDSVFTIGIYKYPIFGDISGKKLVASYAARPDKFKILHGKILLLLEYYGAKFFPENEDMGQFITFLEEKHLEEVYLEKHIDFNSTLTYTDNSARKWGWTARQSKRKLLAMYANYLEEDCQKQNGNGDTIQVKRVQTIDDIPLLQEISNYTENGNYDRIMGHMGAIGLIHFLEKNYIYPKGTGIKHTDQEEQKPKPPQERRIQFFNTNTRPNRFSPRRLR